MAATADGELDAAGRGAAAHIKGAYQHGLANICDSGWKARNIGIR